MLADNTVLYDISACILKALTHHAPPPPPRRHQCIPSHVKKKTSNRRRFQNQGTLKNELQHRFGYVVVLVQFSVHSTETKLNRPTLNHTQEFLQRRCILTSFYNMHFQRYREIKSGKSEPVTGLTKHRATKMYKGMEVHLHASQSRR